MRDGDYIPDGAGGFCGSGGAEEILARALFKLTARRGAFPLLPELGSRLCLLFREKPESREALACQYAVEALAGEPGVAVTGVELLEEEQRLDVFLLWQGEALRASVKL